MYEKKVNDELGIQIFRWLLYLFLFQIFSLVSFRLFAAGGQGHSLSIDVPRGQEVQPGRSVVHVQQRLIQVVDLDLVLARVVLFKGVESLPGEVGLGTEVRADLGHVEVLRLVLQL